MKVKVFSKRHPELADDVYLKQNVRQRIWYYMEECDPFNESHGFNNNWTLCWDELPDILKTEHGWQDFRAYKSKVDFEQCEDFRDFILRGVPRFILDSCELFYDLLVNCKKERDVKFADPTHFQYKINIVFEDANLPWRLLEGRILKADSKWLEAEVHAKAVELTRITGFEGALEEFLEARSNLTAGDYKGAIHTANLALESTIKGITNIKQAKPGTLYRKLVESNLIPDYHQGFLKAFEEHILRSVPMARNFEKGVGHGQGSEISRPPRSLAELAVNLTGVMIVFLLNRYLEMHQPEIDPGILEVEENIGSFDDEIPF